MIKEIEEFVGEMIEKYDFDEEDVDKWIEVQKNKVIIKRVWAMPNKETFKIKPIAELLKKYVKDGIGWVDPFAGDNSPAEETNDLNKEKKVIFNLDAEEFVSFLKEESRKGALFDPPYSLRQIKECYNGIGIKVSKEQSLDASFSKVKDILAKKIKVGGKVISFGWSSNGFGKKRGFRIVEILLVPHGGHHNDTICVVEVKEQSQLF